MQLTASRPLIMAMCTLLLGSAAPWLHAQGSAAAASSAGIYSCTDDQGRRITADRPIPSCTAKEQRVLNKDGSLKTVFPPILTTEERAEKETTGTQAGRGARDAGRRRAPRPQPAGALPERSAAPQGARSRTRHRARCHQDDRNAAAGPGRGTQAVVGRGRVLRRQGLASEAARPARRRTTRRPPRSAKPPSARKPSWSV